MDPAAILSLISELYANLARASEQIKTLTAERDAALAKADPPPGN